MPRIICSTQGSVGKRERERETERERKEKKNGSTQNCELT